MEIRKNDLSPVFPRRKVPTLEVPLAGCGTFDLFSESPEHFTLIVFYRGLHSPICKAQLQDLEAKLWEFERRGVDVVAISCDTEERAEKAKTDWALEFLRIGHGLEPGVARSWGLYISSGRGKTSFGIEEPGFFSEPALYLVCPNRTLYFGIVQTMPFTRPHLVDILSAIDYMNANHYPARGEVVSVTQSIGTLPDHIAEECLM